MQPLQTTDFLAIWQHDGLSHVTGSHQAKQQSQSSMAKLQDPLPNASFRLMRCDALLGRPCHIGFQVVQGELQFIMVAIATGLRHVLHHAAPLVRGVYPCFLPHFDIGKPIFPYLIALSLCISQGDAQIADESGRPVTPVYWHVETNAVCIYSQLRNFSFSEVAAMIEGLIRHDTEMR